MIAVCVDVSFLRNLPEELQLTNFLILEDSFLSSVVFSLSFFFRKQV
jgi:hypothetical protein